MKEVQFGKKTKAFKDNITFKVDDDVELGDNTFMMKKWVRFSGGALKGKLLHRWITDCDDAHVVEHINGDYLDNTRANLRVLTKRESMMNRKAPKTNTTGFKGVSYRKKEENYQAQIGGKYLGVFKTAEEAHQACLDYKNNM